MPKFTQLVQLKVRQNFEVDMGNRTQHRLQQVKTHAFITPTHPRGELLLSSKMVAVVGIVIVTCTYGRF